MSARAGQCLIACQAWLIACQGWLIACRGWLIACRGWLIACRARLIACRARLIACRARLIPCRARLIACGAFLFACGACGVSGRDEAAALDRLVTAYRQAESSHKPAHARALEASRCSAADVCAARAACLASATATADGLTRKHAVEVALAADPPTPGDAKALALLGELTGAEARLAEGHAAVAACDRSMRELRKTYGLR